MSQGVAFGIELVLEGIEFSWEVLPADGFIDQRPKGPHVVMDATSATVPFQQMGFKAVQEGIINVRKHQIRIGGKVHQGSLHIGIDSCVTDLSFLCQFRYTDVEEFVDRGRIPADGSESFREKLECEGFA